MAEENNNHLGTRCQVEIRLELAIKTLIQPGVMCEGILIKWTFSSTFRRGSFTAFPTVFFFCLFVFPPLQPMVFGAMIHRDEAFDAITTQYNKIHGEETLASAET